jgi:hypothetical protein
MSKRIEEDTSEEINNAWEKFIHPYDPRIAVMPVDHEAYFAGGWDACKEEVLKILKQDIGNADLSWETCDERYIERVKKL